MTTETQIIHNGDHLQSLIDGEEPPLLVGDMDARHWVEAWLRITKEKPHIPSDYGTMIGWFANAIMTGYDIGAARGYAQAKEEQNEAIA